jgi:hypothetical protein
MAERMSSEDALLRVVRTDGFGLPVEHDAT